MNRTAEQKSPRSLISSLATGAGVSLAGRAIGRGLTLVSQVLVARLLGPAAYGLYGIGWTILRMGAVVTPLGMDQAIVRFASPERDGDRGRRKGVILKGLYFGIVVGGLGALALFLLAPWLGGSVFNKPELIPLLRWFAPGFGLGTGLKIAADATRVSQRMEYGVIAEEVIQPGTNLLLILAAHVLGFGLLGAAAAGSLSFALALALAVRYLWRLFPELAQVGVRASGSIQEMVGFAIPASLARTFTVLLMWADRLFIGAFLPDSTVGVYQAASLTASIFSIILAAFNTIFSPIIAELFATDDQSQLSEIFKVSTKWGVYISLPVLILFGLAPEAVLGGLFGQEYLSAAAALRLLAVGQFVFVGVGAVGVVLTMAGYPRRWMITTALAIVVEVILSVVLIPIHGLMGGALAVVLSLTAMVIAGLLQVRLLIGLWPYDRRFAKGIVAALVTAGLVLMTKWLLPGTSILNLSILSTISLAGFTFILLLLGLDAEDEILFGILRGRIRG